MKEGPGLGGFRLRRYGRIGSTSDTCKQLAREGEPEGVAILASEQTVGRGTNGRRWQSPAGNLFLSVLLRPPEKLDETKQYALLAGIALLEALEEFLPDPATLSLKWPNDIMLGGAKVAGILVETAASEGGYAAWLVVGFGANIAIAPPIPGQQTACLADAGIIPPEPVAVARAVLARLAVWRDRKEQQGFKRIRSTWLEHAHPSGTPLVIEAPSGGRYGRFAGLDHDGALLLATGAGVERCVAGRIRVTTEALPCCS